MIEIYLIKVIEIHSILSSLGTKTKSYYLNSLCSANKINTSTELHINIWHSDEELDQEIGYLYCVFILGTKQIASNARFTQGPLSSRCIFFIQGQCERNYVLLAVYIFLAVSFQNYINICVYVSVYNYFHCHTLALVDVSRNVKSLWHFVWLNALHNTAKPVIIFYQTANFF